MPRRRTDGVGLPIAAFAALAAVGRANAQQGLFELVPVRASGVEGVDWELGAGPNEITLASGGQDVEFDLFLSDWHTCAFTYVATLDCESYAPGLQGALEPILRVCTDFGTDEFCQGIDTSRDDYACHGCTDIPTCDINSLCPDGSPGRIRCGTTALFGVMCDAGYPLYCATFAVTVSADALGSFTLALDPDPDATFIVLGDATNIHPDLIPGLITVPSGRCCRAGGAPLGCLDAVTAPECEALGGTWTEGTACSGIDETGDFATGGPDGLDDACPLCTQDSHCDDGLPCTSGTCVAESCVFTDLCHDTNACTSDVCTAGGCAFTVTTPAGFCCDPTGGGLTEIDDGDACTADICDDATGNVTHEWICQPVPTVSHWGLLCLAMAVLIAGKLVSRSRFAYTERSL